MFACEDKDNIFNVSPDIEVPNNLDISVESTNPTKIEVTWEYDSEDDIIFYVDRKIGSSGGWSIEYGNTTTYTYVDYSAVYGERNYYRVYAKLNDSVSESSEEVYERPILSDPTNLSGSNYYYGEWGQAYAISLFWHPPEYNTGRTHYIITHPTGTSTVSKNDHIFYYLDTDNLVYGQNYSFSVTATDGAHNSQTIYTSVTWWH